MQEIRTWDEGDGVLAAKLGGLEDIAANGGRHSCDKSVRHVPRDPEALRNLQRVICEGADVWRRAG